MTASILVAGAINTDLVAYVDRAPDAGETITGRSFEMHGGGKGANQAVASARSGASTFMLGGVGRDDFGNARKQGLTDDGVDVSRVQTFDNVSSGVALITVEASGENRISYIPAATARVTPEYSLNSVQSVRPDLILAANELSLDCHRAIFGWAREQGVPVVYNVAPYSEEARELLPLIDVLIVNEGEAHGLLGMEEEHLRPEELGTRLMFLGVRRVIVTLGKAGTIGVSEEGEVMIPGMKVDAVDTTGAGDAFCGAVAARLVAGATFEEAIRYGNAAGAIAVTRRGAQSSIPTRSEIERFMAG